MNKYEFIHLNGDKENCTIIELCKKYNLFRNNVYNMIKGTNKSVKGWRLSTTNIKDTGYNSITGINNRFYDPKIYNFQNIKTKEVISTTINDFQKLTKINKVNIKNLCKGKIKHTKGYKLASTSLEEIESFRNKGIKHPRYDHNVYKFVNEKTNVVFTGTQNNFINNYKHVAKTKGAFKTGTSALIKGKMKTYYGWKISA